jgi:hypothetical protein
MNCQDFEKLALTALARNRLIDAGTRKKGTEHAEACERCAARLAQEKFLLTHIGEAAAEMAGEEPPARVEEALLAAYRAETAATAVYPMIGSQTGHIRRWSGWQAAAIAAGILLVISMAAIFWRSTNPKRQPNEDRAVAPKTMEPIAPPNSPDAHDDATPSRRRTQTLAIDNRPKPQRRQSLQPRAPRTRTDKEDFDGASVTQFFSLVDGEDLTAREDIRLVRVELPGSALSEVGLPVDPETARTTVKADIALGEDGLARAIRFVR